MMFWIPNSLLILEETRLVSNKNFKLQLVPQLDYI